MDTLSFVRMRPDDFKVLVEILLEDYANRQFTAGNYKTLKAAKRACNKEFSELLPKGVESLGHHFYMLKEKSNQNIGSLWFSERASHNDQIAWLSYLLIEPSYRRRGFAQKALQFMENQLISFKNKCVGLNVFSSNKEAINLYTIAGYTVSKEVRSETSNEVIRYEMEKPLKSKPL